ncbi:head-tail connector protein [Serratia fonticola]|uniref:head-tail connector protein n=1 Tax=Serratia fonticola TaxID=47917 RepID=UPI0034C5E855
MIDKELVKQHCRIEPDFTGDDTLIETYTKAATRYVETWTRRKLYKSADDEGYADDEDSLLLGDDVVAAVLLLIGHWYSNRETVTTDGNPAEVPFATTALLQPYRIYGL